MINIGQFLSILLRYPFIENILFLFMFMPMLLFYALTPFIWINMKTNIYRMKIIFDQLYRFEQRSLMMTFTYSSRWTKYVRCSFFFSFSMINNLSLWINVEIFIVCISNKSIAMDRSVSDTSDWMQWNIPLDSFSSSNRKTEITMMMMRAKRREKRMDDG